MLGTSSSLRLRYAFSVAVLIASVSARLILDPILGDRFPFATLFLGVLIAAAYAGRGPALLTTFLGAVASARFLLPPRSGFQVDGFENRAGLVLFLVVGVGISLLGGALRAARRHYQSEALEAIRQREQLRITLASIGDAVLITDADGRITSLNAVAEELTGWTLAEAKGKPMDEIFVIVNQSTRKPAENPAQRALREGRVVGLANHTILIAKDGRERHIDDSAAPIRQASETIGVILVFRDITETRHVERELQAREREFHKLADSIPHLVWIAEPDGNVTWYNRRWYDYTGALPNAMNGWKWQSVHDPEVLPAVMARWTASLASGEPFEMVFPLKGTDGRFRPFLTRVMPVVDDDGRIVRWFGTNTDITESKNNEKKLFESEKRLSFALKAGRMGAWELDLVNGVMTCSETCKINYGRQPSDPFGYDDIFNSILDADRAKWRSVVETAIAGGSDLNVEYRVRWPDGSIHWVCVQGSCETDESGRTIALSGVSFHIDERKRAEIELLEADRRKSEFLAILAHELRNPLAPLRNSLQIMKMTVDDPAAVEEARLLMERQLAHMVRLIDDLMDVSRINRAKLELRRERVELAAIVHAAVDTSRPLLDASNHTLTVNLPDSPVLLDADVTRLAQVFSNLLNNAAKYTEPGGEIALTVAVEPSASAPQVIVTVRDNGVGIPAEMLPTIFEMFTQVDRSLERSQGGLGIGLTLVRTLVEMHGGTVEARSPGHGLGSEFVVRLAILPAKPQTSENGSRVKAADKSANVARTGLRILVVDDNRDSARTLGRLLKLLGHTTFTANDGGAAIQAAEENRPQLILLDIGLPVMNGYDVARTIRQRPWSNEVVIIALTGWGQESDRLRSKEAGIDDHLVKPIDPAMLEELLNSLKVRVSIEPNEK